MTIAKPHLKIIAITPAANPIIEPIERSNSPEIIKRPAPIAIMPNCATTLKLFLTPKALKPSPEKGLSENSPAGIEKYPSRPKRRSITPKGPISGLDKNFFIFVLIANEPVKPARYKNLNKYIANYLSIPASAATEDALDESTNPGPDGMLSPGKRPAALLYKCKTTIGI